MSNLPQQLKLVEGEAKLPSARLEKGEYQNVLEAAKKLTLKQHYRWSCADETEVKRVYGGLNSARSHKRNGNKFSDIRVSQRKEAKAVYIWREK